MRLTELDPRFIRYETRMEERDFVVGDQSTWRERGCPTEKRVAPCHYLIPVDSIGDAQGIKFLCPKCYSEHAAKLSPEERSDPEAAGVGIHGCEITFSGRGVSDDQGCHNSQGKPTRWDVQGSGFDNLTTKPSILIEGGCGWHGFITNGEVS